jgi:UDP-glucose 4-epimerase
MAGRRILITGIASYLGTELARRLEADPDVDYIAGLDTRKPSATLERTDFLEADIRNPVIAKLIAPLDIDTVVHNQIVRRPGAEGMTARKAHDVNVIGSLQLLAACERASTLRAIVVRGSAGIYGAEPGAPQFFTEAMTRLYPLRTRFQRDVGEIENLFETFRRRHPHVTCTMLRYQPSIGPSHDTQVTRYLSLPVVPTYLGFDPRVQFVHEADALDAFHAAVRKPVPGAVNVAAAGTIGLTKLIRRAGKVSLPIASGLFSTATAMGRRVGLMSFSPDFRRLLRYGRAVDTTRLVEEIGFRPQFDAAAAVERTIQTTLGSAQQTRGRAQEAVDDLVSGAEAGAKSVRRRVRGAIESGRPATLEDVRELEKELRAVSRRLDALEKRLPAARTQKRTSQTRSSSARKRSS